MAKFCGVVGYGETVEIRPGVSEEVITEYQYFGDVIRNARRLQDDNKVLDDVTVSNSISIVADQFAQEHIFALRYVKWNEVRWRVTDVEVVAPRLILRLGGVYNGPTPAPVTP